MKKIKLKKFDYTYIQSRKYDWRKLDRLICDRELIEIECPSCEEARAVAISLTHNKPGRDGVYTVSQNGNKVIVDATGGSSDGR